MTRSLPFASLTLVLLCASLVSAQEDTAVEIYDYTVQRGDTCAAIARRAFGDRRRYDIIHEYNPDMGPPPHRLEEGTILRLPRTAPTRGSGPDARVTAVVREVDARAAEEPEWRRADVGLGLYRGWRVTTQVRSEAELTFRDTSTVHLRSDTLVIVYGGAGSERVRRAGTSAQLDRGTLRTRLGELSGGLRLQVTMPSAEAELRGGSAVVGVDEGGSTRLSNHGGAAAGLTASGGRVAVPAGMGSIARRGSRPERPRPLPDAPAWAQGPNRFLGVAGSGGTLSGSWAAVPSARRYRVEVASRPDGRGVVAATEVPSEITRFEIHRLPPGTYYVSLSSIDGDGLESLPSTAQALQIVGGRLLAPGESAASEPPAHDPGDPSEEPGPLRVMPGSRLVPPAGVRCALDASEPVAELVLPSAFDPSALRCVDAEGEVAPLALEVVPLSITDAEGRALTELEGVVGEEMHFSVTAPIALPQNMVAEGSEGLEVVGMERSGDTWTVRAIPRQPGAHQVVLRVPEADALATLSMSVREPSAPADAAPSEPAVEEPTPADPPARRLPFALPSAFGAVLLPSVVGLSDLERRGSGVIVGGSLRGEYERQSRARGRIGAVVTLLDEDRLGFGLDFLPGFTPGQERAPDRGADDLHASVSYRFLDRTPLGLAVEVGAFFPSAGSPGHLQAVRLVPSVHLSWSAIDDLLVIRTRQAGIFELADTGGRLWASAYGADLHVVGPLSLAAELDLSFGVEGAMDVAAAALGGGIAIDLAPVVFELGGRAALGSPSDAVFGPFEIALSLRLEAR